MQDCPGIFCAIAVTTAAVGMFGAKGAGWAPYAHIEHNTPASLEVQMFLAA